jgi:hypothetical protein
LWFVVPKKIKNHTLVHADPSALMADVRQAGIEIKEQIERS